MQRRVRVAAIGLGASLAIVPLAGAAGSPPVNAAPPALSGTARAGQSLTTTSGSWGGTAPISYAYAWQRCDSAGANCASVSGTSGATYRLGSADAGHTVRARVTASNADGSGQALSPASAVVAAAGSAPAATSQPTPNGSPQVGQTLTADSGSWSGSRPFTYAYQWQRCAKKTGHCANISGATANSYQPVDADVGHELRYGLVATNSVGSGSTYSNLSATVAARGKPPVSLAVPVIVGNVSVGQGVAVSTGVWSGASSSGFSYLWNRCTSSGACSPIPGATSSAYVVASADAGQRLQARVTASNANGKTNAVSQSVIVGTTTGGGGGGTSGSVVPVTSLVAHPDHLLISDVKFSPSTFSNPGGVFTIRVKVSLEGTDKTVSGALVQVTGIPYSWVTATPETPTGSDGWAVIQIKTTKSMPHSGALVMQVRARAPGNSIENILGGISTRRLVQLSLK